MVKAKPNIAKQSAPPKTDKPEEETKEEPRHRYIVRIRNNFHYLDGDCEMDTVEFTSPDAAMAYCDRALRESLDACYKPGMTAEQLVERYKMFGDDPWIVSTDEEARFSAWTQAEQMAPTFIEEQERASKAAQPKLNDQLDQPVISPIADVPVLMPLEPPKPPLVMKPRRTPYEPRPARRRAIEMPPVHEEHEVSRGLEVAVAMVLLVLAGVLVMVFGFH